MKQKQSLGQRIQQLRLKRELTQQNLADKIGASLNTISKIEQDYRNPSMKTLEQIAKALHCEVQVFIIEKEK